MEKKGIEKLEEDIKKELSNAQNRQLKNILIFSGVIILVFLLSYFIINSNNYFEYNGLKFNAEKYGEIIMYKTIFPLYSSITGNHVADYNLYLRNDPRKLKDIPFNGEMNLKKDIIIYNKDELKCDGYGILAVVNMNNFFKSQVFDINFFKNETLKCDSEGRYMFIQIQESNETNIEQFGPSCYYLNVNDCEILEVTEKFIMESLTKINLDERTIEWT